MTLEQLQAECLEFQKETVKVLKEMNDCDFQKDIREGTRKTRTIRTRSLIEGLGKFFQGK